MATEQPRRRRQKVSYKTKSVKIHDTEEPDECYREIDGIKIYDGITAKKMHEYKNRIDYLISKKKENMFTPLQPSTLTASGRLSNILIMEEDFIKHAPMPTGSILKICCNFGKKINPDYKSPVRAKTSQRGRKPKNKLPKKRRVQGSGEYFNSQVTFYIRVPDKNEYLIKLFRNGTFQVPGVQNPAMTDLVQPVLILRDYLRSTFDRNDINVIDFRALMRNYKCRIINAAKYRIYVDKLEQFINMEKYSDRNREFVDRFCKHLTDDDISKDMREFIGNYNPMNMAEITYNIDRSGSLVPKFYRPTKIDANKKITVKLLKKGKINFDGGISQEEIEELYHWFEYIYEKYKKEIMCDIETIKDHEDSDEETYKEYESIYDDEVVPNETGDNFIVQKRAASSQTPNSHKVRYSRIRRMLDN
jgi:hypothetical protein